MVHGGCAFGDWRAQPPGRCHGCACMHDPRDLVPTHGSSVRSIMAEALPGTPCVGACVRACACVACTPRSHAAPPVHTARMFAPRKAHAAVNFHMLVCVCFSCPLISRNSPPSTYNVCKLHSIYVGMHRAREGADINHQCSLLLGSSGSWQMRGTGHRPTSTTAEWYECT